MISEMLGHSSTSFTMDVYGHVLPNSSSKRLRRWTQFYAARKAQREREEKEKSLRGAATSLKISVTQLLIYCMYL